jgi:Mg2+/Co2+ transporter CorB
MNEHAVGREWVIVGFATAALILAFVVALLAELPKEILILLGGLLTLSAVIWFAYFFRVFGFLARENRKRNK